METNANYPEYKIATNSMTSSTHLLSTGFVIYFGYGMWNSSERRADDQEVILYDVSDKDSMIVDGVYR